MSPESAFYTNLGGIAGLTARPSYGAGFFVAFFIIKKDMSIFPFPLALLQQFQ
jgi:hypothetical protein